MTDAGATPGPGSDAYYHHAHWRAACRSTLGAGAVLVFSALAACAGPPERAATKAVEHPLFGEVYQDVIEYHIDAARADSLALSGLRALAAIDPTVSIERSGDRVTVRQGDRVKTFAAPPPQDSAAWGALTGHAIDFARAQSAFVAAVPPDEVDEQVIDGALATLDPFSRYVRPAVGRERRAERDGFDGIGITIAFRQSQVWIASVQPDTPAAAAGLLADDRIVAVDGVSVKTLAAEELRRRLRGKPDTMVVLAIARQGEAEPLNVSVPRAHIVEPAVTLQTRDGIAWLKVTSFNQQTGPLAAGLLQRAHRREGAALRGIVLDLRNNPGGLLDQSIELASLFLARGPIASTIGRLPESFQNFAAPEGHQAETLPLVVLVNGGSASASEIVASALQDSGRAVVIGTASYGKGTVQTVIRTTNDGELTVTWAQLITPLGYRLNHHGVVPSICTDGLSDMPASAAQLLQAAGAPPDLAAPRANLDDSGWLSLRAHCPPRRGEGAIDSEVAERLLDEPALYHRALASIPIVAARAKEAHLQQ
ncbi:MAG TPA: S41 family peptidase [Stellaceae bacterium]|nr:S41 family peptidase [Stellaceae bacterium]